MAGYPDDAELARLRAECEGLRERLPACLCIRCTEARNENRRFFDGTNHPHGFRFACELCGNKRCPHHTDHNLACTGSNRPGQPGSDYT